ncbi:DNA polymerase alpha/epsilon subunit B-domain-containing protein [Armillaria novae-zelandiae]|uniref:DNA polymerase alpha/epsilon subunit B-domain-containing protein n=1 Tax=Armillaria novae-zelandiae TaxID=153914 RepID=A0AA39PGD9_9AGAR|nr:DNA polymerase alpha/epsilon subunit B-domain-containing protein [Armillaria novae-zelandiae]
MGKVKIDELPIPATPQRSTTCVLEATDATPSFRIGETDKSYKHQYSNIYFTRLSELRKPIEERALKRWANLCYVVGTVYMDMPLKPNVLEDIARDHSIPPPPPPPKYCSPEDSILLEDESGRIKLVGERVKAAGLVTGVVVGALGVETPNGEFEVVDLCYPGMAPQPAEDEDMELDGADEWIAVVSGLGIGSPSSPDVSLQMLVEYLTGEEGGIQDQGSAARISRLVIAGNSLAAVVIPIKGDEGDEKKSAISRGKYNYDTTTFSPHPTETLAGHLYDIGRVMPIHVLPGETDPSGTILPQQPFPRGLLGPVASLRSFSCETNPTYIRIGGSKGVARTMLVNSGQPLNDMFKYVTSSRLSILASTLSWRHMAPTAPDTLWCHPYFGVDPFVIRETPDVYIVGGQKKFGTKLVREEGRRCRLVLVPEFARTGTVVLVNVQSLEVKTVKFGIDGL